MKAIHVSTSQRISDNNIWQTIFRKLYLLMWPAAFKKIMLSGVISYLRDFLFHLKLHLKEKEKIWLI